MSPSHSGAPMPSEGSSSLLAAVTRARTTATWVLASLGAAASAILVGATLKDLSRIEGTEETVAAVVSIVAIAGGIAAAIFAVSRVLAPIQPLRRGEPISPFRDDALLRIVSADPLLLSGLAESPEGFEQAHLQALRTFRHAQDGVRDKPQSENALAALLAAQDALKTYEPVSQYLRDLAVHEHARRRYDFAIKTVGICCVLVIVGAVAFNLLAST